MKLWKLVSPLIAVGVLVGVTGCDSGPPQPGGSASTGYTITPQVPPPPTVSPQDLDKSTYSSLTPRDFALLIKDPDSHAGQKIIVYGKVTQFDAATGKSEMRVNTAALPGEYSQNTFIEAKDPSILANVVEKDLVTMWCKVKGSYTYKNTMGGQMTVPQFWVNIIDDAGPTSPN